MRFCVPFGFPSKAVDQRLLDAILLASLRPSEQAFFCLFFVPLLKAWIPFLYCLADQSANILYASEPIAYSDISN
jgi:hypothetical protein